ncbi:MAG: hypothetical protein ACFE9Q_03500 [Candidatus Hodarchaeota archaeon]
MNDNFNFRQINEIEKEIIITSLNKISSGISQVIYNLKKFLYISIESSSSKVKFPKIFLISRNHYELLKTIDSNKILSAGLYLGFIKKGNFLFSLEGAEFLYISNLYSDFKKLYVNEKGEKSILYGNNILKNMILKIPESIKQNDLLLIFNQLDEIIALAKSNIDYTNLKNFKQNDIIAINLIDKGDYLRKSQ